MDFNNGRLDQLRPHEEIVPFVISDFDRGLVEAGGWVDYADTHYA